MRILPNLPLLRVLAVGAWAFGSLAVLSGAWLLPRIVAGGALLIALVILGCMLLALGVAYWLLGGDQRASIVLDPKGILLNLGSSSAFISWSNIERTGVSRHRSSLLALGSRQMLGIALRDPRQYVQSYEERIPAAHGLMATAVRMLERSLRPVSRRTDTQLLAELANNRARTGYDLLLPDSWLGGSAAGFTEVIKVYHNGPDDSE